MIFFVLCIQEKIQLEEELKSTNDDQRKAELSVKLNEMRGHYNPETSEWEKRMTQAEGKLRHLESKKKKADGMHVQ